MRPLLDYRAESLLLAVLTARHCTNRSWVLHVTSSSSLSGHGTQCRAGSITLQFLRTGNRPIVACCRPSGPALYPARVAAWRGTPALRTDILPFSGFTAQSGRLKLSARSVVNTRLLSACSKPGYSTKLQIPTTCRGARKDVAGAQ